MSGLKKPKSPEKKVKAPESDKKRAKTTKEVMDRYSAQTTDKNN